MMIGSVVWSRDEVVQDHWRQGSQAVCWRGGPHKVLKSTRVRGESLGERKTTDSSQGLDRGGAESETALGSDSLESDGLPSCQCQVGPPPTPCVNVIAARVR